MAPSPSHILHILILHILVIPNLTQIAAFSVENEADWLLFHGDYSPPSPPPPSPPPHSPAASCEADLQGVGSLDSRCDLSHSFNFTNDVYIAGKGSLFIHPGVILSCPFEGCSILFNLSGELSLGASAEIGAGTVAVKAFNVTFAIGSVINVTALGGRRRSRRAEFLQGFRELEGGHGGRGASCVVDNKKLPEDVWGGDAYAWSTLTEPWSYGSRGGTTSREEAYGGRGGGRIGLDINNVFEAHGSILADGGDGGTKGGGGSGGSIFIKAQNMMGSGKASASGGSGFAGGGGGRVSANVFSMHDEFQFLVHGGGSYGCPKNSGAAGTFYDVISRKLVVSNHNKSTDTDTLLLEFPNQPLWTNVFIRNRAKAAVPLLWSRVQVQGQLSVTCGSTLSFGLAHYGFSEFELMAEELLMSDSLVKVYGALRMTVKVHLMWNSTMLIDGDGDSIVSTSLLEASNLVVLRESSVIHSNANLGVHGQGFLNLSGPGDLIEAQRLVLSLFYSITLGTGSILRGPLENASNHSMTPKLYCGRDCPDELLHPPEDCSVNSTLAFTLQICRVEDINIEGFIEGSVVHFHWVRSVAVKSSGVISASGLGCTGGVGRGMFLSNGLGGGGGHGGKGGGGYYNGSIVKGGVSYGNANLPCELGSGSGNSSLAGVTLGAGIIVMGSLEHSLDSLSIDGSLRADGESFGENIRKQGGMVVTDFGPGGGSGGTILVFLQSLSLRESSAISTAGGHGGPNGGGGGGGRVHFHWSNIPIGDEYFSLATVNGSIHVRGGQGGGRGYAGENGTVTGKTCPRGLYGIFCQECPVGTYKNVSGSNRALCRDCPSSELPSRAIYTPVRGGCGDAPCPYKCLSERYRMPHCYTALEELVYTFGGPWLFGFILLVILVLLALVLSVARMKFVSVDELPGLMPTRRGLQIDRSLPFLESLNEVLETNRTEESKTHVHRLYFMGPNTFSEPWHLPYSPPEQVLEIVYEEAFNTFVDEINALAAYHWWEGSMYSIMSLLAYPLAWSWLQWRQKIKIQRLREFVRSEYDHACLRSCRSRALYEGLKVAATSDLMLGYVDFFLGGDEKRADLPPQLGQRLPMSVLFGGDGSYMAPFSLQSDSILTSLMSQSVPPTTWYRLVAGLNAQLRLVRCGHLRKSFSPILSWLDTLANPTLKEYGVRVDLACFQPTANGYRQFGLGVLEVEGERVQQSFEGPNISLLADQHSRLLGSRWRKAVDLITHKRTSGGILYQKSLQSLEEKKNLSYPLSFVLHNVKPVGHQDLVGLVISILLLGDFSLVLLALLQLYSFSLLDLLLFLFLLPLGILCPFPAGINALFSHGPRRSAGLARLYALWNILSLINVIVAFICGFVHYKTHSSSSKKHQGIQSWNFNMDDGGWWMLSFGLVLCKVVQARLINYHVANLEIQDRTLYSNDADVFWQS